MFEEFSNYLRELGKSPHTIRGYLSDLNTAINHNIMSENLSYLFMKRLPQLECGPATKHRIRSSIRKYARFLVYKGVISSIPVEIETIDLPSVHRKIPNVTSVETMKKLINTVSSPKIKLILLILSTTGCRISSLAGLNVEDFDLKNNQILFKTAKGNKPYYSILTPETKEAFLIFVQNKNNGPLFINNKNKRSSESALRIGLKRYLKEDYCNPHSFRHGIATELIVNGTDILTVKEFLNHSNSQTTENYIHLTAALTRKKLEDKHPFLCHPIEQIKK